VDPHACNAAPPQINVYLATMDTTYTQADATLATSAAPDANSPAAVSAKLATKWTLTVSATTLALQAQPIALALA
jgi:hypothetical protein